MRVGSVVLVMALAACSSTAPVDSGQACRDAASQVIHAAAPGDNAAYNRGVDQYNACPGKFVRLVPLG